MFFDSIYGRLRRHCNRNWMASCTCTNSNTDKSQPNQSRHYLQLPDLHSHTNMYKPLNADIRGRLEDCTPRAAYPSARPVSKHHSTSCVFEWLPLHVLALHASPWETCPRLLQHPPPKHHRRCSRPPAGPRPLPSPKFLFQDICNARSKSGHAHALVHQSALLLEASRAGALGLDLSMHAFAGAGVAPKPSL